MNRKYTPNDESEKIIDKDTTLKYSFVIPAFNESVMLKQLIDSIRNQQSTPKATVLEILVVDANSTDNTVEVAKNSGCEVISTTPGSVSKSRNIGASQASGNIIAFIDADCELPENWLSESANQMSQPDVIATGAKMKLNPNNTWVERTWHTLAHRSESINNVENVEWLATFNMAVKKSAFVETDGFNEELITCEDVEFGYRLNKLGLLTSLNSCQVIHLGESKTLKELYLREAWRSRGSLLILRNHWRNIREVASFFLPFAVTIGLLVSITIGLIPSFGALDYNIFSNAVFYLSCSSFLLPILFILIKKRPNLKDIPLCSLVLIIYFIARFTGTIRNFPRLRRS